MGAGVATCGRVTEHERRQRLDELFDEASEALDDPGAAGDGRKLDVDLAVQVDQLVDLPRCEQVIGRGEADAPICTQLTLSQAGSHVGTITGTKDSTRFSRKGVCS